MIDKNVKCHLIFILKFTWEMGQLGEVVSWVKNPSLEKLLLALISFESKNTDLSKLLFAECVSVNYSTKTFEVLVPFDRNYVWCGLAEVVSVNMLVGLADCSNGWGRTLWLNEFLCNADWPNVVAADLSKAVVPSVWIVPNMLVAWFELEFYWFFCAIALSYGWLFGISSGDELFGYGDEESVL